MRIADLRPSDKVPGRWLCFLDDGSLLRLGEGEVVRFGLYAGLELEDEQLTQILDAAGESRVRERALALLAARPMSRRELIDKLTAPRAGGKREPAATPEQAARAADRLEELGYLDDGAYARLVAERCAARGYGERRVRDELFRRGVPREHWDGALEGLSGPEAGIDEFLRRKLGDGPADRDSLRRAANALARRGYRWEDIQAGLRRYGGEIEEDSAF